MTDTTIVRPPASKLPPTEPPAAAVPSTAKRRWIPGDSGIWAFILTDMSVFAVYFIVFAWQRTASPEEFTAGRGLLSLTSGAVNTFLLVTASLFIALAVNTLREGKVDHGRLMIIGAAVCGLGFVVSKYFEWGAKVGAGITPLTDGYFQLYYMLTGIHLLHVLVALVVLTQMWRTTNRMRGLPTTKQLRFIENGASYWHMVDLIWLGLFALFYLMS